jgi:hypothetical protein
LKNWGPVRWLADRRTREEAECLRASAEVGRAQSNSGGDIGRAPSIKGVGESESRGGGSLRV